MTKIRTGTSAQTLVILAAGAIILAVPQSAVAAERVMADVTCKETKTKFVFDCRIMLMGRKSHKAIQGAKITINANMPSMPMAHNVKPVHAVAMGKPGRYHARLHLQMYGEWALKLAVTGPTRDIVIKKQRFSTVEAGGGMHKRHGGKKTMERTHN
ncbi:MAG TPA: FixH family protein [Alphaproteobacteria bacterium]|nr:FixH family protein [Alphaproteobacteria bacterium]